MITKVLLNKLVGIIMITLVLKSHIFCFMLSVFVYFLFASDIHTVVCLFDDPSSMAPPYSITGATRCLHSNRHRLSCDVLYDDTDSLSAIGCVADGHLCTLNIFEAESTKSTL